MNLVIYLKRIEQKHMHHLALSTLVNNEQNITRKFNNGQFVRHESIRYVKEGL